jgi:L-seryl-tRNA(Ser) seleniumtransferase
VEAVVVEVARLAKELLLQRCRPVINATGIVLHTNLGRAPLSDAAVAALVESAGHYASLELDLVTGQRGRRGAFAEAALGRLVGAEAVLLVNNCAAAVLLMLSVVAAGRSVIVSRGELVEIGGGFRVPEVMEASGVRLIEVGTTNRTRLDDYVRALDRTPDARAILRVHQGNFRQVGFVERPELADLAGLARQRGLPLLEDLGGGALVPLGPYGLAGEPLALDSLRAGVDVVCFSTDKALGGPQGGALVGRKAFVELARRAPLARALRLGRLPLVALEATLTGYLEGDLDALPTLSAMRKPTELVRARAAQWATELREHDVDADVIELSAQLGGGTSAEVLRPSFGVSIHMPEVDRLAAALRTGEPSVVARIHEGRLVLDARTVLPREDESLLRAVVCAIQGIGR